MGLNAKKAFATTAGLCFSLIAVLLFVEALAICSSGFAAAWRHFTGAILSALIVASFDQLWWQYEWERLRRQGLLAAPARRHRDGLDFGD